MCVCVCVCVCVYRRHSQKWSTDVSVVSRTTARSNEERRESRGDYRLLFIQRRNNFEWDIRVCDVITKRAQGERKRNTFSQLVTTQIGFSLFFSLRSPLHSLVHLLAIFTLYSLSSLYRSRFAALRFTRGEPFGFPMVRRR